MCDFAESSHLKKWLYKDPDSLDRCRARANRLARRTLIELESAARAAESTGEAAGSSTSPDTRDFPIHSFARGFEEASFNDDDGPGPPLQNAKGNLFLTPQEEALLVSFYVAKIPGLIGPQAFVKRLRRDTKVTATATLLVRRFFLSNSVMLHDPAAIVSAAAFLGSKIEDAMCDVRYIEEGSKILNATVTTSQILPAEVSLLNGVQFDLMCFHPHKAVLALTEDLRTYLKSEKGKSLVRFPDGVRRPISGQDLVPIHDAAQQLLRDVIVSDVPLLYSPGQIGLAALMIVGESPLPQNQDSSNVPKIDLAGYIQQRFEDKPPSTTAVLRQRLAELCEILRGVREGKYGCGNHNLDLQALKAVHKKLKKCRAWGSTSSKKRKASSSVDGEGETTKRVKT